MRERRNYYRILHVQEDAPEEVITASYRTLMQRMRKHPDLGGDPGEATSINEAYATLKDSARRQNYDQGRPEPAQRPDESTDPHAADTETQEDATSRQTTSAAPESEMPEDACPFCAHPHPTAATMEPDRVCAQCETPLFKVDHLETRGIDRRAVGRLQGQHRVVFLSSWPQSTQHVGTTIDVSPGGMLVSIGTPLEPGQIIRLDCDLLRCAARVTRTTRVGQPGAFYWHAGIMFLTLRFSRSSGVFVSVVA